MRVSKQIITAGKNTKITAKTTFFICFNKNFYLKNKKKKTQTKAYIAHNTCTYATLPNKSSHKMLLL